MGLYYHQTIIRRLEPQSKSNLLLLLSIAFFEVVLSPHKREQGDEESSGLQPNASPAADQRLDGRKAAQFVREAAKNKNE